MLHFSFTYLFKKTHIGAFGEIQHIAACLLMAVRRGFSCFSDFKGALQQFFIVPLQGTRVQAVIVAED